MTKEECLQGLQELIDGSDQKTNDTDRAKSINQYIVNRLVSRYALAGYRLGKDLYAVVLKSKVLSDVCKAEVLFYEHGSRALLMDISGALDINGALNMGVRRELLNLYVKEREGGNERPEYLGLFCLLTSHDIAARESAFMSASTNQRVCDDKETPPNRTFVKIMEVILSAVRAFFSYITSCFTHVGGNTKNDLKIKTSLMLDDMAALNIIQEERSLANSSSESLSSLTSEAMTTGQIDRS